MSFLQGLKKHKLLREDILPALASNRKVQRLLNEFMDLLSEYGSTENNIEQNNSIIPMTSRRATDRVAVLPSLNDHMQLDTPVVEQIARKPEQTEAAQSFGNHQMDSVHKNQINEISPADDQVTAFSGKDDTILEMVKGQVNPLPSSAEPMNIDMPKVEKVVVALPAKENST